MKKEKLNRKLVLKKETISSLSDKQMTHVKGGGSTRRNLTCGLCTDIGTDDVVDVILATIKVTVKL